jgi:hypothetical protein
VTRRIVAAADQVSPVAFAIDRLDVERRRRFSS